VKRGVIIGVVSLCLVGSTYANPVTFHPVDVVPYALIVGSAVVVEAGIATLLLLFWGTETKPLYAALIAGNLAIYLVVFLPLLDNTSNVWFAEGVIVGLDGLLIKILTLFDVFQDDTFRPLRWRYAFLIATVSNVVSYCIGLAATG